MKKCVLLLSVWLLAGCASAAINTVRFSGRVTSASPSISIRSGFWVTGFFTYDPLVTSGQQSASHTILAIEIPEAGVLYRMSAYGMGVSNNRPPPEGGLDVDGVGLTFGHPALESGSGGLRFSSTDTTLFSSEKLPTTFPSIERFDANRHLSLFYDFQTNYWGVGVRIDQLSVVSVPGILQPVIYDFDRLGDGVRFRFNAESRLPYTVEFAESLTVGKWIGLTNVTAKLLGFTAVVSDTASPGPQRFYRVRQGQ